MIKLNLEREFDGMLPYMKKEFPGIVNDLLARADRIDQQGLNPNNTNELMRIHQEAEKLLSVDRALRELFSKL